MNLSLHSCRVPARLFYSVLFFLFLLSASPSARATGETITRAGSGNLNPCGSDIFTLFPAPPAGYEFTSVDWYENGTFQQTITGGGNQCRLSAKYNDGTGHMAVYCVAHYKNGSLTASGTSNTVNIPINAMFLTQPTASGSAVLNCNSNITYTTQFDNSGLPYVPTPSDVASFNWGLPTGWWYNVITNGSNGGVPYSSANVFSDGPSSGNVFAVVTLTCGYTQTSPILPVSRITPPPGAPSVTPIVCAGGSASAAISAICGPTSYTYSVPSGYGVTFTGTGGSSQTTTSTSVGLAVSGSAPSGDIPVSVVGNYPNGTSSVPVTTNMHVGVPTTPANISGSQGSQYCPGSYFDAYAQPNSNDATSWLWGVSFTYSSANGLAGGQGQQMATISLPGGYTYSYQGQEVDEFLIDLQGVNACGTSSWVATMTGAIVSCDGGGGGGTGTIASRRTDSAFATGFATKNTLSVYPNPAASAVYIALPDSVNLPTATITLSDIHGRQLKKLVTVSSVNMLPLSGLASGIYFVEIFDGKKILSVQKVVKK